MNVAQDDLVSEVVYDVLIVGAGPVGLATAIALWKRGIHNILVIDQTSHFRQAGQVVDILPNGLKAIKYIDEQVYQQIKEIGLKLAQSQNRNQSESKDSQLKEKKLSQKKAWHQKNLRGEIIRSIPLDFATWFERYGEGRVSISWYDLQTTLRRSLPPEIVQANHRCINVTKSNGYIEVDCTSNKEIPANPFAHWKIQKSEQVKINSRDKLENQNLVQKQFRAKLVVAADGINSTIRELLYGDSDLNRWAKPQYSGIAAIGCWQIDNVPDEIAQELDIKYFQGEHVITLRDDTHDVKKPWIMLLHRQNNTFGYLVHTPLDLNLLKNKSSEAIIKLAIAVLEKADFPVSIIKLVSLSTSEGLFHRPYYIHPTNIPVDSQPIWSDGRLVLVGDAAHGMPPFAAQGANQGFEDAALISTLISNIFNY